MNGHVHPVFRLHKAIQIKPNQNKTKQTLPTVIFNELLLKFPPLSPRGRTLGDGNIKGEMGRVCHGGQLSGSAVPKRGPTQGCVLRGCLINTCWLADRPRCENKMGFSGSRGEFIHLTISSDLRRAVTGPLVSRFGESRAGEGGAGGRDAERKTRTARGCREHRMHYCTHGMKHTVHGRRACQSPHNEFASGCQSRTHRTMDNSSGFCFHNAAL